MSNRKDANREPKHDEDYLYRYGIAATILFVISETGKLKILATDRVEPEPGDTVISLLLPQPIKPKTKVTRTLAAPVDSNAVAETHFVAQ